MSNIRNSRETDALKLAEYIKTNYHYGMRVPYTFIEDVLGIDRFDTMFLYLMSLTKEILIEQGYVLVAEINEGYKILEPKEVANYVIRKHLMKSVDVMEKGRKMLHYTPRTQLNKEQKEKLDTLERFISELHKDNEDKIIKANYYLNEARVKELNRSV